MQSVTIEPAPAPSHPIEIRPLQPGSGPAVRRFCLDVISEVFGHPYRADWHDDLDRLTQPTHDYQPEQRGWFLVAHRGDDLVGCGGLRSLTCKPSLAGQLAGRYPAPDGVGSIWRVYVAPDARSAGLGRLLVDRLERKAVELGYTTSYLHTSATSPRSVAFWERCGYRPFRHDEHHADSTIHLDRSLLHLG
jgi:GNAT superfamily N-acetyltransferase